MLIYHPAFDAYHCVYRLLKIINKIEILELSKLRILDFYIVYPAEIYNIRSGEFSDIKKIANSAKNEFHGPVNSYQAFRDMQHLQFAAISTLAAARLIDSEKLSIGIIARTDNFLPQALSVSLDSNDDSNESKLEDFILTKLAKFPLNGVDGLKHRSGLMEYRYDHA